mmetsp:Transcript_73359/g.162007  ORF Transcript_73359/g.162007 Transcript_73359/m.162007 type:complete len:206 (-) Transcript_73359:624-1241(-)
MLQIDFHAPQPLIQSTQVHFKILMPMLRFPLQVAEVISHPCILRDRILSHRAQSTGKIAVFRTRREFLVKIIAVADPEVVLLGILFAPRQLQQHGVGQQTSSKKGEAGDPRMQLSIRDQHRPRDEGQDVDATTDSAGMLNLAATCWWPTWHQQAIQANRSSLLQERDVSGFLCLIVGFTVNRNEEIEQTNAESDDSQGEKDESDW